MTELQKQPARQEGRISVLCVEDNAHVADALRLKFGRLRDYSWLGWLSSADDLVEVALRDRPTVLLLDIDMPGRDPFEAARELTWVSIVTRVVVFSGHVREDLIDAAMEAGAWGYVSKNDGEDALLDVVAKVVDGEVAFSPEVRLAYRRR